LLQLLRLLLRLVLLRLLLLLLLPLLLLLIRWIHHRHTTALHPVLLRRGERLARGGHVPQRLLPTLLSISLLRLLARLTRLLARLTRLLTLRRLTRLLARLLARLRRLTRLRRLRLLRPTDRFCCRTCDGPSRLASGRLGTSQK